MKKALVTGGTGFVGSNLVRELLKQDYEVHIIAKKEFGYKNIEGILNKVKLFEYNGNIFDLIEYMKNIKVDVVFHLASLFIAEHISKDVDILIDSNIKFGAQLLEAMKESDTQIIINTGTSWQHFNSDNYNPVDLYAATKEAFENILKYYSEAENIRAINLKLFDTYGENDTRPKLINLLNKFADEGKELDMSLGEQVLDLVHVEDVVKAFISSYNYIKNNPNVKFETYAVASEEIYKLKEVIACFEELTGKKININWGKRPYRKREVMTLWKNYKLVPNWSAEISLKEGLARYKSGVDNEY